ncbi:MAG: PilZ domain-containing protein [Acidobacteria bacterium]|nr:PilZ domain-containing protein [Acidobacteriota bacterium]
MIFARWPRDICGMVQARRVMSTKTLLIAHRAAAVRDRFAVALADARHEFVTAATESEALKVAGERGDALSLALVDLGLSSDPLAFLRAFRQRPSHVLPLVVFSGSVPSAAEIPALSAMGVGYINEHAATPQILPALAPHLFPDNFNRRMNPRMTIGVPVTYRTADIVAGAITLDIGKGGIAIRTMTPLPKGTPIHVRFRLPGMPSEIDAAGRVAWSDRKVGMGVQFEQMSSTHQRTIDSFVDANGQS